MPCAVRAVAEAVRALRPATATAGRARTLAALVVAVGVAYAAACAAGVAALVNRPAGLVPLAVVTAAMAATTEADRRRLRVEWREGRANHDVQSVWLMLAVVLLPGPVACLVAATGYGHRYLRLPQGVPVWRLAYNVAAIGLSVACSTAALAASQAAPAGGQPSVPGLAAAGAAFVVVNTALVVLQLRLQTGTAWSELVGHPGKYTIEALTVGLGLSFGAGSAAAGPSVLVFGAPAVLLLQQALATPALKEAALTDAKTGQLTPGAWRQLALRDWQAYGPRGTPAAVLLIDLDHFKVVNDTHGHLLGDKVLAAAAEAIRRACRPADKVGRFGGEEFVVVAWDLGEKEAVGLAERVRAAVAAAQAGPSRISVTASVGVAAVASPCRTTLDEALHEADLACYSAKQAGRDRVSLSTSPPVDRREPATGATTGALTQGFRPSST